MFDVELKTWLIEVNASPSLSASSYDDKLLIHSTYDQLQYMCFELNDEDLQKMVIVSVFFSIDHLGGAALHATPPYPPCPPSVI